MAKVYLDSNETYIAASNATLIGNSGTETVKVNDGVVVTSTGSVERIELTRASTSYTYQATATGVNVLYGGAVIASLMDGQKIAFTNGSATIASTFDPTTGVAFTLGGASVSTTAGPVSPTLNTASGEASTLPSSDPSSSKAFTLTTGMDFGTAFTGTAGDDTYDGSLSSSGGQTLNTADNLNGAGGTDSLIAELGTATTYTPVITAIENVATIFTAAATLDLTNATGVTTLENTGSTNTATFNNIASTSIALKDSSTDQNVTFGYTAAAVAGTADSVNLTVTNVSGGTVTLAGIETVNIASAGNVNTIGALTAAAATKLVVTGSKDLTITTALATGIATIDASAATGAVTVEGQATAQTLTGGAGNDSLSVSGAAGTVSVTAGAGDDSITFASGTATLTNADVVDGGAGANTLHATIGNLAALTTSNKITNVQTVSVLDARGATDLTLSNIGTGVTGLIMENSVGAATTTFNGGSSTVRFNNAAFGAQTFSLANTNVATTDALTMTVKANLTDSQNITTNYFETLTIADSTAAETYGTVTMSNVSTGGSSTLNFTGSKGATISSTTASKVDASGLTGTAAATDGLVMGVSNSGGTTIIGSANNDTLYGTNSATKGSNISAGAGNDIVRLSTSGTPNTVDGGAGNDSIYAGIGSDSLSGGDGNDSFFFDGTNTLTNLDTVDGGAGTNTLSAEITSATPGAFVNVTNIQQVALTGTGSLSLAAALTNGLTSFDLSDSFNQALTLAAGYAGDTTVSLKGDATNVDSVINAANVTLTVTANVSDIDAETTLTSGTGTTDTINMYADDGTAILTGVSGFETLNVLANTTDATLDATVNFGSDAIVASTKTLTVNAAALTDSLAAFTFDANGWETNATKVIVTGGAGNDSIKATSTGFAASAAFSIDSGAGADTIYGGAGKDTIVGGAGNDSIVGAAGNDSISGGDGTDTFELRGADLTTNDTIDGGTGTNTMKFTDGVAVADTAFTHVTNVQTLAASGIGLNLTLDSAAMAAGVATLTNTASQNDSVTLTAGFTNAVAVTMNTDAGAGDTFDASATAATVTLTATTSTFIDAFDVLKGGTGTSDKIVLTADDSGTGAVFGNNNASGWETIQIKASTSGTKDITIVTPESMVANSKTLVVDASLLLDSNASLTLTATETGTGIYSVIGGAGNDSITLGAGNDIVSGGEGNNTIVTGDGNNVVTTGAGADTVTGGAGNDSFTSGAGSDSLTGAAGNDTIDAGDGHDTLLGGAGADSLLGGAGNDIITGGTGADYINSGDGNDVVVYNNGADSRHTTATTFSGDTLNGFDFAKDTFGLASTYTGQVSTVTVGTAALATLWTDLGADGGLQAAFAGADIDSALVTISAGTAAGTYMIIEDGTVNTTADASDFIIKVTDTTNVSSYAIGSFGVSSAVTTLAAVGDAFTGTGADETLNIGTLVLTGTAALNGGGGTNTLLMDTGSSIAARTTNITNFTELSLVSGASVTMTAAQNNAFTGTITAAGSTEIINLSTASTSITGLANIESYVLASGANTITIGAANQSVSGAAGGGVTTVYLSGTYTGTLVGQAADDVVVLANGTNITGATVGAAFDNLTLAANASVTMTEAQNNSFDTTITAAGAETINIAAGDLSNIEAMAAVETYVLGEDSAGNAVTFVVGAAAQNVTSASTNDVITLSIATGINYAGTTNVATTGSIVSLTGTNTITGATFDADFTKLTLAAGSNTTLSIAQHNQLTSAAIDATATSTLTMSDAGTFTGANDADITYVLATGTNVFTLGATGQDVTGGAGDDTVKATIANLVGATISGTSGTDVLQLTDAGVANINSATITTMDGLTLANGGNTITFTGVSGVKNITGGTGADAITISNMTTGGSLSLGDANDSLAAVTSTFMTNVVTIDGGDGTGDSITFANAETILSAALANVTGVESINFGTVANAANAVTLVDGITSITANTGTGAITVTGTLARMGALTAITNTTGTLAFNLTFSDAGSIDLSSTGTNILAITNDIDIITLAAGTNNVSINTVNLDKISGNATGGTSNTITATAAGTYTVDDNQFNEFGTLTAATGTDAINFTDNGLDVARTINGNAGANTISIGAALTAIKTIDISQGGVDTIDTDAVAASGRAIVTGFTPGVGAGADVLNFGAATLTGTNNFVSTAAIVTLSAAGALDITAGAGANDVAELFVVTASTLNVNLATTSTAAFLDGTNLLLGMGEPNNSIVATNADKVLFAIGDTSGNVGIYYAAEANNDAAIVNTEIVLIGVLQNVAIGSLAVGNFTNV